jgi:predicted anti-sigma-YlaC factor YlaD
MNGICESVRDDLPLLAAGTLPDVRARQIEAHLESCAACRAERALIGLLRTPLAAPMGLEARVRRVVATAPAADRHGLRTFAAAAAVASVIAGGVLALQWVGADAPDTVATQTAGDVELGWAARIDPLLDGGPGLQALSDEELELLLEEMQS